MREQPMKYPPFIKDKNGRYERIPYELMITTKDGKGFTQETLIGNDLARAFAAKYSRHFYQKGGPYNKSNDETVYFHGRRSKFSNLIDSVLLLLTAFGFIGVVFIVVYVVAMLFEMASG